MNAVPLRVSLVALLLVVVGAALVMAGFAATTALRGYLLDQVDAELADVTQSIVRSAERGLPQFPPDDRDPYRLPSAYVVQVNDAQGQKVGVLSAPVASGEVPPDLPGRPVADLTAGQLEPYSVEADGESWRVVAVPFSDGSGSLSVATSIADETATVRQLAAIEVVIGVLVMTVVGLTGWFLVRRSLRPLADVERTAAAIAAGDLSVRVPGRDPRTEVGRVSQALNTMLERVETSFRAQASSEAEARASEERMRRFVADASHELRTPLTSIRGFAELHRRGVVTDPDDVTRAMRRIEDEAARMGLLVEDLLLLARLDQQRPLDRVPVDMLALASDAVHDARAIDPGRPVTLEVLEGSEAPMVVGDEARLRQVVSNLLGNAMTHTPAGTPVTVRVGTAAHRDGPDGVGPDGVGPSPVVLEVADAGPGLTPEEAERVFERFYRGDPSRTRTHGGTGLGLSIVAALVAAHGGRVDVVSEPGSGATFRVLLPRMREPVAQ